jgi:hypothetical protein
LKTYDSIKEESLTDITSSKNIVSCCVKDLSFQINNNKNNNNEIGKDKFKNKNKNPTKINISIEENENNNGESTHESNSIDKSSKLSNKLNKDKQIQFSIILPQQFQESKNYKIKLSMDMSISVDDDKEPILNNSSILQSKNSITSSTSFVTKNKTNNNSRSQSKGQINEKDKKTRAKRSIIEILNSNESLATALKINSKSKNKSNDNKNKSTDSKNKSIDNKSKSIDSKSKSIDNKNKFNDGKSNSRSNSVSSSKRMNSMTSDNKMEISKSSSLMKTQNEISGNNTLDSSKNSMNKNTKNINSNSNLSSSLKSNSNSKTNSISKMSTSMINKDGLNKVIEQGNQKGNNLNTTSNSISENKLNPSSQSSVNTIQQLFASQEIEGSKPPLASNSKCNIIVKNNTSKESLKENSRVSNYDNNNRSKSFNGDNESSNNNNKNLNLRNLYLPNDNNKLKSQEELSTQEYFDDDEIYSPIDDEEYDYIISLIDKENIENENVSNENIENKHSSNENIDKNTFDNESTTDKNTELVNLSESNKSHESIGSSENKNNLSRDPSIIYNDDNKEKLERCYSSSFELTGVWKHFIVPYTTDSDSNQSKSKKDCASRLFEDYTIRSKGKAYHHWIKVMLPEYSSFISRHSLPTICAQNYIIAALIEKMSFFKMAEEDPNPVVRESSQYNIERLDICLNYIKNIMDIPIAVTSYDLHHGKLASVFSLLTQLIRYNKRGQEMKSKTISNDSEKKLTHNEVPEKEESEKEIVNIEVSTEEVNEKEVNEKEVNEKEVNGKEIDRKELADKKVDEKEDDEKKDEIEENENINVKILTNNGDEISENNYLSISKGTDFTQ